jgi:hypothetical protein
VRKAFAPQSGRRAERNARRNVERDQARLHVPAIDRTFGGYGGGQGQSSTVGARIAEDGHGPPPVIVAVIGPPGVGKSTLVRSLVRRYTKTTIAEVKGPITLVTGTSYRQDFMHCLLGNSCVLRVTGKARRLTIIECPNDLGAIVDVAKVADLVLLMIDGSFGFEMVCSLLQHSGKAAADNGQTGNIRSFIGPLVSRTSKTHSCFDPSRPDQIASYSQGAKETAQAPLLDRALRRGQDVLSEWCHERPLPRP